MKTFLKTFYILNLSFCILNSASAQYNAANGIFDNFTQPPVSIVKEATNNDIDTASAACNGANNFWGISSAGNTAREFNLTSGTITYTGRSISNMPGLSLAACDNLNGGAINPTLYTTDGDSLFYWNGGTTWTFGSTDTIPLNNCGGNGSLLYIHSFTGPILDVIQYTGTNFTGICNIQKLSGCADIAVDVAGNFVFVSMGAGTFSDSIFIISPTCQIIKRYPFNLNVNNAYGCFLLNGVYYIGIGPSNMVNPNKLIPVTFTSTTAVIGAPISFPTGFTISWDLANCNPGNLLDINSITSIEEFTLSPNPAQVNITITMAAVPNTTYTIYNTEGKIVIPATDITNSSTPINVSHLKKGIYFAEIKNEIGIVRKKFAKM